MQHFTYKYWSTTQTKKGGQFWYLRRETTQKQNPKSISSPSRRLASPPPPVGFLSSPHSSLNWTAALRELSSPPPFRKTRRKAAAPPLCQEKLNPLSQPRTDPAISLCHLSSWSQTLPFGLWFLLLKQPPFPLTFAKQTREHKTALDSFPQKPVPAPSLAPFPATIAKGADFLFPLHSNGHLPPLRKKI